jgi:hypothetical protein
MLRLLPLENSRCDRSCDSQFLYLLPELFFQNLLLFLVEAQPEDSQFVQRSLCKIYLMELKTDLLFNFSNLLRVQLKLYDLFHRAPSIKADYKSFSIEIQAIFGRCFGRRFYPKLYDQVATTITCPI